MSKLPIWSFSLMKPAMKWGPVVMNILKNSMIIRIVLSSDELVWHNHQRKSRVLVIWSVPTDVTQSTYVIMHFAFPNGLLFREIDCLKYGRFRPFADSHCSQSSVETPTLPRLEMGKLFGIRYSVTEKRVLPNNRMHV